MALLLSLLALAASLVAWVAAGRALERQEFASELTLRATRAVSRRMDLLAKRADETEIDLPGSQEVTVVFDEVVEA